MKNTPIPYDVVEAKIKGNHLTNVGQASIREIKKLVDDIEAETGQKYVRMEMGIPGLPPAEVGVQGQIEALKYLLECALIAEEELQNPTTNPNY